MSHPCRSLFDRVVVVGIRFPCLPVASFAVMMAVCTHAFHLLVDVVAMLVVDDCMEASHLHIIRNVDAVSVCIHASHLVVVDAGMFVIKVCMECPTCTLFGM